MKLKYCNLIKDGNNCFLISSNIKKVKAIKYFRFIFNAELNLYKFVSCYKINSN